MQNTILSNYSTAATSNTNRTFASPVPPDKRIILEKNVPPQVTLSRQFCPGRIGPALKWATFSILIADENNLLHTPFIAAIRSPETRIFNAAIHKSGSGKSFSGSGKSFSGSRKPFSGSRKSFSGSRKSFSGSGKSFSGSGKSFSGSRKSFSGSGKSFSGSGKSFSGSGYSFSGAAIYKYRPIFTNTHHETCTPSSIAYQYIMPLMETNSTIFDTKKNK